MTLPYAVGASRVDTNFLLCKIRKGLYFHLQSLSFHKHYFLILGFMVATFEENGHRSADLAISDWGLPGRDRLAFNKELASVVLFSMSPTCSDRSRSQSSVRMGHLVDRVL